nr:hypothetical protein [uncultured Actinoplanes sp.]
MSFGQASRVPDGRLLDVPSARPPCSGTGSRIFSDKAQCQGRTFRARWYTRNQALGDRAVVAAVEPDVLICAAAPIRWAATRRPRGLDVSGGGIRFAAADHRLIVGGRR